MNGFIEEKEITKGHDANGKMRTNLKVYNVKYKYKDENGKWTSAAKKGFRRKSDAEAFLVEIQHQISNNRYIPNKKTLLKDSITEWYLTHVEPNLRPNTVDGYHVNINHIINAIGNIPLQVLTASHIQAFYNSLYEKYKAKESGGLSPKSILYIHRVLSKFLDDCVRKQLIPRNVSKDATRPKVPKYQCEIYTAEELKVLVGKVYNTDWEVPIILAGLCGMRRGEILGLQWQDLNFTDGTINIQRTVIHSSKGCELSNSTKTESSRRTIAISDDIIDALKRHWKRQERYKLALKDEYQNNDLINCKHDGTLIVPNNFSRDFKRLLAKHELKHIRFHDLRHSAASLMLLNDVPMKVISDILGHSSVNITSDLYTHVIDESKKDAANKISSAIFNKVKEITCEYNV